MGGASTQFQPGDVIAGKYRIEQALGEGGMGIVLLATHLEIGQKVAIKFLFPEYALEADSALRFLREARAAASLTSDNSVRVHDVGRLESGAPYMVMEYLEGRDLGRVVQEEGALAIDRCVDYVLQAIDAIGEAHAAGIVHRDLKPSNLFLAKRGRSYRIKVLDFGISKIQSDAQASFELTKTAAVLGSPFYMAPEQMRSTRSVDHRADIWSLGVILYELSTAAMPFQAATLTELCLMIAQDEPQPLRALRTDVPPELERIVSRCLQKNPADRFASVAELAEELERCRSSDPFIGPPSHPIAHAAVTGPSPMRQPPAPSLAKSAEVTWGKTRAPVPASRWRPVVGVAGVAVVAAAIAAGISIRSARGPSAGPTVASSGTIATEPRLPASEAPSHAAVSVEPPPPQPPSQPPPPPTESAPQPKRPVAARAAPSVAPIKTAAPPPKPSATSSGSTFSHDRQ
jgi:serine/threonine protein kinase